jgi:hypothetical protein
MEIILVRDKTLCLLVEGKKGWEVERLKHMKGWKSKLDKFLVLDHFLRLDHFFGSLFIGNFGVFLNFSQIRFFGIL